MQIITKGMNRLQRYTPIDLITLVYVTITGIYILAGHGSLNNEWIHIAIRIGIAGAIIALPKIDVKGSSILQYLRAAYPLALLGFFYSETDYLNNILLTNQDALVETWELWMWGYHPSLEFSKTISSYWFNELMNFGYFSYYLLVFTLSVWLFIKNRERFTQSVFIVVCSFYIFYTIFILFPVAGPQFYFAQPLNQIPDAGIFRWLVKLAAAIGEGETAAFPSSHVGITVMLIFIAYRWAKPLFIYFLLIGIILCFSTVYIKAHYAVDIVAGLLLAPIIYFLSVKAYNLLNKLTNS